jgi:hypothetical protein
VAPLTGHIVEDGTETSTDWVRAGTVLQLERSISGHVFCQVESREIRRRGFEGLLVFPEDGGCAARQGGVSRTIDSPGTELQLGSIFVQRNVLGLAGCRWRFGLIGTGKDTRQKDGIV